MPADVHECAERRVAIAHDDERHVSGTAWEALTRLGGPLRGPRVMPRPTEDLLLLGPEHVRRHVPLPGQRFHGRIVT